MIRKNCENWKPFGNSCVNEWDTVNVWGGDKGNGIVQKRDNATRSLTGASAFWVNWRHRQVQTHKVVHAHTCTCTHTHFCSLVLTTHQRWCSWFGRRPSRIATEGPVRMHGRLVYRMDCLYLSQRTLPQGNTGCVLVATGRKTWRPSIPPCQCTLLQHNSNREAKYQIALYLKDCCGGSFQASMDTIIVPKNESSGHAE